MPSAFFFKSLGAHFQWNSLKTQAAAAFFLHPLPFPRVAAVSWIKSWQVEFSQRHCHARTEVPENWQQRSMNACMEVEENLQQRSMDIGMEVEENWQQRSMNVCMEVEELAAACMNVCMEVEELAAAWHERMYGSARELAAA